MKQPAFNTLLKQAAAKLDAFDFGEALKLYNQANNQKPGNAAAQMGVAVVLNRTGESANALVILQKLWQAVQAKDSKVKKETQSEIMAQVGLAFEQLGQTQQALGCYRLSYSIASSETLLRKIESLTKASEVSAPFEQLINHAQALVNEGNIADATRTFKAALVLNADSDIGLHGLADCLRQMNDLTGALQCIQQAILLKPNDAVYQNTLGLIYLQGNEATKAVKIFLRAIKLNKKFATAYINLGVAYKRLENLSDAVKAYETAIKLRPDMPQAHNNLGNVFNLLGDKVSAKKQYEIALKLQPNYIDALKNLDEIYKAQKKNASAKKGLTNRTSKIDNKVVVLKSPKSILQSKDRLKASNKTTTSTSREQS
jgi:tetratricopeptide (TPR) repeat protein